jgi:hypothetical protein
MDNIIAFTQTATAKGPQQADDLQPTKGMQLAFSMLALCAPPAVLRPSGDYEANIGKDLPAALKRLVAQKTGIAGGLVVSEVTNSMDKVVKYGVRGEGIVWKISLSDDLVDHFGFKNLTSFLDGIGDFKDFQMYAFCLDYSDVTFVCEIEDDGPEYRKTHEPFPEDAFLLPPHLRYQEGTDYEDAWIDQQVRKLWPAHMERVLDAFWSFLTSPLGSASSKCAPETLIVETDEARKTREANEEADALAFYQRAERQRQDLMKHRRQ